MKHLLHAALQATSTPSDSAIERILREGFWRSARTGEAVVISIEERRRR